MKQLNVIIAGAGIGGLTTAIALQQKGHKVKIFDKVPELLPAGSAISIWSNGVKVLDLLGIGNEIRNNSGRIEQMTFMEKNGKKLTSFDLNPLYEEVNAPACPIARTTLQSILLNAAVTENNLTLGKACIGYINKEDKVEVLFDDDTKMDADLLVGADGIHSILRNQVNNQAIEKVYCGYINWNGRVKACYDLNIGEKEWIQSVSDGKRVSLMPMGDGNYYFFFDVPLPKGSLTEKSQYKQDLKQYFQGWHPQVQRIIDLMDPLTTAQVEICKIDPLETFIDNRVVLVGDAAHATSPDLGQGGCMAMEDAFVLANFFEKCDTLEDALNKYEQVRAPRANDLVRRAYKKALITHGYKPKEMEDWYKELESETGENIINGLKKTIQAGVL